ncbi:hypothetical protein MCOR25_005121 [Pyricularia grisea]|uniref:Uncharacterized protein n=1 Tax=Pyricularia grisea TaxID=148305 RepID=A0A6P8BB82_PYRGI|nr:uncharacterized protein PgNI_05103 [Pyricularia grisea]KAI6366474.1 hypothetical protein MCOR25_005121 [Pyricularia grisea]TLD13101.1 hypothetical protein PgNI_05103 [Pyricularia grisea]
MARRYVDRIDVRPPHIIAACDGFRIDCVAAQNAKLAPVKALFRGYQDPYGATFTNYADSIEYHKRFLMGRPSWLYTVFIQNHQPTDLKHQADISGAKWKDVTSFAAIDVDGKDWDTVTELKDHPVQKEVYPDGNNPHHEWK